MSQHAVSHRLLRTPSQWAAVAVCAILGTDDLRRFSIAAFAAFAVLVALLFRLFSRRLIVNQSGGSGEMSHPM